MVAECAGLSEGAPCDDSNAATTDDSCHDDQCGGWQSFPTIVADQAQKDAWLTCEGVRHPTLAGKYIVYQQAIITATFPPVEELLSDCLFQPPV